MLPVNNHLGIYRKRSTLSQEDIAYLLNHRASSALSRYERGERMPTIEFLLTYHLLYDTSIENFFPLQKKCVRELLQERLEYLLEELQGLPKNRKVHGRMSFLDNALNRLKHQ